MKKTLLLLLLTFSINSVFADCPLTSTDFYKAYMDVPMVQEASISKGKITTEMMDYIDNDTNPLEIKLAIINAIGWNVKGLTNSKKFFAYVINKKKYKTEFGGDFMAFKWYATRDELICFSYLKAMDNYFDVVDASEIASEAIRKYPDSFAVTMIYNLIKAQGLSMLGETCYASKLFQILKNNSNLKMDMKKESMSYIFEYLEGIGKDCKTN